MVSPHPISPLEFSGLFKHLKETEGMAKPKIFLRSEFNYDMDEASLESALTCEDESLTVQSQAEEADINVLVRRFGITGQIPVLDKLPTYQNFEGVFDYRTALESVMEAERMFMEVPAEIRARFHNDPGAFVDFCSKADNLPELRKMGLAPELPPVVDAGEYKDVKPKPGDEKAP